MKTGQIIAVGAGLAFLAGAAYLYSRSSSDEEPRAPAAQGDFASRFGLSGDEFANQSLAQIGAGAGVSAKEVLEETVAPALDQAFRSTVLGIKAAGGSPMVSVDPQVSLAKAADVAAKLERPDLLQFFQPIEAVRVFGDTGAQRVSGLTPASIRESARIEASSQLVALQQADALARLRNQGYDSQGRVIDRNAAAQYASKSLYAGEPVKRLLGLDPSRPSSQTSPLAVITQAQVDRGNAYNVALGKPSNPLAPGLGSSYTSAFSRALKGR